MYKRVLETRGGQFKRVLDDLIAKETDPRRQEGLRNSMAYLDIEKIEKVFSPTNILIELRDVSRNLYHSGSGTEHLLKIIFKAPDDREEKQEPTYRVIEISMEANDLHYVKDGVSRHDWWSLVQVSKWKSIEYGDFLTTTIFFVLDVAGEEHLLGIDGEGRYQLHSRVAYHGNQ